MEMSEHRGKVSETERSTSLSPTTAMGTQIRRPKMNKYALGCAVLASTNSILLGYDIGVISGAALYITDDLKLTGTQQEILTGILNLASLIGSLASGKTSDRIGRRYTIVLAASTFFIGAILMSVAPSYSFLMAGRVVAGIGVGYSLMISPLYTAEISPAMSRGLFGSLPEFFITVGILLGYICNYAFSGLPINLNWRIMLGLAAVPAVGIGIGAIVMPESPRWLAMKGRFEEARRVLLRTSENEAEAEERLGEISKVAAAHGGSDQSTTAAVAGGTGNWHGQGVWKELLLRPSPATRRILMVAIGMNIFMQGSGNDAVVYYLPEVFGAAGIHNKRKLFGINVIVGLSKAFFVMISALYLDKFGRRPLLLLGTTGMTLSLIALGTGTKVLEISQAHHKNKPLWAVVLSIVAACGDVSFFSIGLGPITWVYSSEIFPMRLRAQGTALAISVNRVVSGIVTMTYLSVCRRISFGGAYFLLSGVMFLATVFFYFCLPETKGKSLEEIEAMFEEKYT